MLRIVSACALLLALLPTPAAAEWHFVPMVGLTFKGETNIFGERVIGSETETAADKTHKHLAGAISLLGEGTLRVEAFSTWTPGFFQTGDQERVESSRTATLMGNIVITTPRKWTEYGLRPYVSGGFGLIHATVKTETAPTDTPLPPTRVNNGAYNFRAR